MHHSFFFFTNILANKLFSLNSILLLIWIVKKTIPFIQILITNQVILAPLGKGVMTCRIGLPEKPVWYGGVRKVYSFKQIPYDISNCYSFYRNGTSLQMTLVTQLLENIHTYPCLRRRFPCPFRTNWALTTHIKCDDKIEAKLFLINTFRDRFRFQKFSAEVITPLVTCKDRLATRFIFTLV
jgi:hypothetical protein